VPALTVPPASPPAPGPELIERCPSEPESEGIPGLSVMDVLGNLEHFRAKAGLIAIGQPLPTAEGACGSALPPDVSFLRPMNSPSSGKFP
jgi:hypothetical protein